MVFRGNNIFLNNSGFDGGGMALYGSSYIVLSGPAAIVNLTGNSASHYGGGMYVSQPLYPVLTTCFFQKTHPVHNNTKIVLSKNTAGVTGSALYGGNQLSTCLPNGTFDAVFQFLDQPRRPNDISSDPDKVCLCNEYGSVNCYDCTCSTSAVPGKQFSVSISAVGNHEWA